MTMKWAYINTIFDSYAALDLIAPDRVYEGDVLVILAFNFFVDLLIKRVIYYIYTVRTPFYSPKSDRKF